MQRRILIRQAQEQDKPILTTHPLVSPCLVYNANETQIVLIKSNTHEDETEHYSADGNLGSVRDRITLAVMNRHVSQQLALIKRVVGQDIQKEAILIVSTFLKN